ncbi:MAG TPA: haloacid dehalogenase [Candidatus Jacksonbacteria bacterium]|nr:haloacid dehalogenase [Candidatus Jacksonbacteria bacterium]
MVINIWLLIIVCILFLGYWLFVIYSMQILNLKPRAVIFDMDGVLIDSEKWWPLFERKFFIEILGKWSMPLHREVVGRSIKDIHQILTQHHGLKMNWQEFRQAYDVAALDLYNRQCSLMPGARAVIEHCAKKGINLAVASSAFRSWIDLVLTRFELTIFFKVVVSAEDVGGRGKPAPDIYLASLDKLGLPPEKCLVIEDSKNGILAGKAAKIKVIGYRTPDNVGVDLSAADQEIANLEEIIKLL